MSEIKITREGREFRERVLITHGAERLTLCYQCGTCTSDCPIAKRVKEFRPRNIARLTMYGQKERLLGGDLLWLCAGCYTCYERCPQKVHVSEIIAALRGIALSEGTLHASIKGLLTTLPRFGYIYEIGEFENEMRTDDGLPPAPEPAKEEMETIMRKTGLLGKVRGEGQ